MDNLALGGEREDVAARAAAALPDHEDAVRGPVGQQGGVGLVPADARLKPLVGGQGGLVGLVQARGRG